MSIVSSPLNFNDLKSASVYYEILNCDDNNLQPIFDEALFEKQADGSMAYYRTTANGSYTRATGNRGEFVRSTRPADGQEIFLHYSQVFCPTRAARRRMNTLAYVLGMSYQNSFRQMAMLNDLINEAAALNESMRKFGDIFCSFSANAANYDSGLTNQVLQIDPELLQRYIDNGLRFPLNSICNGMIPQLYAEIDYRPQSFNPEENGFWKIFFIDNTEASPKKTILFNDCVGKEMTSPSAHTINDCLATSAIANIVNSPELMARQFSSTEKYKLSSRRNEFFTYEGTFFAKCNFNSNGDMVFRYLFGLEDGAAGDVDLTKFAELTKCAIDYDIDRSASCYSATVPLGSVAGGNSIGYFSQKEANAFIDQIRIAIDQRSNELNGLSTMINVHNQDLQQIFAVATSTLEASEETQQKTARTTSLIGRPATLPYYTERALSHSKPENPNATLQVPTPH
ncbi:MAG: hypothetical protein LBI34_02345 [Puniceicoccales bacterium]|jgi:hypothetical protein|nr:hypothetical protein [Puniceicoccales bacterium]